MAPKPAWMPTGLGASKRNLIALGVALAGLAGTAWYNLRSDDPVTTASTASPAQPARVPALRQLPDPGVPDVSSSSGPMPARRVASRETGRNVEEFHPTLKPKEDMDVSKIDPTLRTELLDKVRQVGMEGGSRNLFEFSKPPEPPAPQVTITPGPVPPPQTPKPPVPPVSVAPPGPPPPPPIPLKYFGYAGSDNAPRDGKLRGLFLEGDPNTGEYYVAGESELIKNRYKVVRIGIRSAELVDTTNDHKQTMPLVEEQTQ
ncbi:MAG TPA: hypothetical protein VGN17_08410 [Bryobacteraceae bacterium]|jgi:hypothetical protein